MESYEIVVWWSGRFGLENSMLNLYIGMILCVESRTLLLYEYDII